MTSWIRRPHMRPRARVRLFCFPHAGGTTDIFSGWSELLGSDIELALVQLPGRGQRFRELPITQMSLMIARLKEAVLHYSDIPSAFFGHSMGALIAFELSRSLQQHPRKIERLFLSACPAPQRLPHFDVHTMNDAQLIDYLAAMGGTPFEILQNRELAEVILPIVRSDFELVEKYQFSPQPQLQVPLSLCLGESDPETGIEDISLWGELSSVGYNVRMFPGNHFFVNSAALDLTAWISTNLAAQ